MSRIRLDDGFRPRRMVGPLEGASPTRHDGQRRTASSRSQIGFLDLLLAEMPGVAADQVFSARARLSERSKALRRDRPRCRSTAHYATIRKKGSAGSIFSSSSASAAAWPMTWDSARPCKFWRYWLRQSTLARNPHWLRNHIGFAIRERESSEWREALSGRRATIRRLQLAGRSSPLHAAPPLARPPGWRAGRCARSPDATS